MMFLRNFLEWRENRRALREYAALRQLEHEERVREFDARIADAEASMYRGAQGRALDIWTRLRALYPDLIVGSRSAITVLIRLGDLDEAEQILLKGRRRFPNVQHYAESFADVALRRGDYAEALVRAKILRRKFPDSSAGYRVAADALVGLERFDEAAATLRRGVRRLPEDRDLGFHYIHLLIRRKDWATGAEFCIEFNRRFPTVVGGPVCLAECLGELARYDEAEAVLRAALSTFPLEGAAWRAMAVIAERQGHWDEAVARWTAMHKQFPHSPEGYIGKISSLRKLGREALVEELLAEATDHVRLDSSLASEYARVAHRRQDWQAAVDRWAVVRERAPQGAEGYQRGAEALAALGRHEEADSLRTATPGET